MLRRIRPEFAEFYASLLIAPAVQGMIGQRIIETSVAADSDSVEGYPLTLEHRKLSPLSFCYEWPAQMLCDAALLTLDICIALTDEKLVLQDAYPWNVVFEGPRPIFVDFTSITPQDPNLPWVAYDQFCRFFLYPLVISSCRPNRVTRGLLLDHINGVSDSEMVSLLPLGALIRMPWLIGRAYLPRLLLAILRRFSNEKRLSSLSTRLNPSTAARQAFFRSLRRDIAKIPLRIHRSRWSRYYADIQSFMQPAEHDRKQATVARLLDECRPKTLVDIGCNRGGYSILAAKAGASVVAFDTDEDSVALLYELARDRQLAILPLVIDFLSPSPCCGWRCLQYAGAPQRLRSEMALGLALIHHLAITQRQTFERIVPALADYADKWLLTEFVPLEDPRSRELLATHRRDMSWYSLQGFIDALKQSFRLIETFPSYPEGRTLVLCTR